MQDGRPVQQPNLLYRPARLQRLIESIPWNRSWAHEMFTNSDSVSSTRNTPHRKTEKERQEGGGGGKKGIEGAKSYDVVEKVWSSILSFNTTWENVFSMLANCWLIKENQKQNRKDRLSIFIFGYSLTYLNILQLLQTEHQRLSYSTCQKITSFICVEEFEKCRGYN
jgi:hypothetical protein